MHNIRDEEENMWMSVLLSIYTHKSRGKIDNNNAFKPHDRSYRNKLICQELS